MERISNMDNGSRIEQPATDGWEAWDAVPRDGPAVFVVDALAFGAGVVRGRWLPVGLDEAGWQAELTGLLGRPPVDGNWAVIDQVGLGQIMVPETMAVADLPTVVNELAAEARS